MFYEPTYNLLRKKGSDDSTSMDVTVVIPFHLLLSDIIFRQIPSCRS